MLGTDLSIIGDCVDIIGLLALNKSSFSFPSKANRQRENFHASFNRRFDSLIDGTFLVVSLRTSLINDYVIILMRIDLIGHQ